MNINEIASSVDELTIRIATLEKIVATLENTVEGISQQTTLKEQA